MSPDEALAQLKTIREEALRSLEGARDAASVRNARIDHLGRRSPLAQINAALGSMTEEDRREVGRAANEVRHILEEAIQARLDTMEQAERAERLEGEAVDVTLAGRSPIPGRIHPITKVTDEIVDVFLGLGFRVAEGPEVETEYYNFEALNTPPGHPARSEHDSFYIVSEGEQPLLRTHTSPVQVRVMESQPPPVYVIVPGRCARRDVADPTHYPVFHQVEGLAVDDGISLADMKGTLEAFAQEMFGEKLRVRLMPHYFPFTEPSADVSVSCFVCGGTGCRTCHGEGWIEVMGAGMVHPNVFDEVGYPPDITGFAFGMGVERIAMLRYEIPDIRLLFENDLTFLGSF